MTPISRPKRFITVLAIGGALLLAACFGSDAIEPKTEEVRTAEATTPVASTPPVENLVADDEKSPGNEELTEPAVEEAAYVRRLADVEKKEWEIEAAEKAAAEANALLERERELRQREAEVRAREVALAEEELRLREQQAALETPPVEPLPTVAPDPPAADTAPVEARASQPADASRPAPADHDRWSEQAWRRGNREPESDRAPSAGAPAEEAVRPRSASLEAGTVLTLRVESDLSSKTSSIGEEFSTRVTEDVRDEDGQIVVPAGSELLGFVTDARPLRRVGGRATLGLEFDRLVLPNGEEVEVRATLLQQGKNKKRDKAKIAGAAIAGAIIGQILGGDSEATAAGAAVGAAASTAAVMRVKGKDIEIPAGSELEIELTEVVTWTSRYLGVVEG